MFAAIRPGLTEPKGHFRSFFAVSTQKYGLARQSHALSAIKNMGGGESYIADWKQKMYIRSGLWL